MGGVVKMVTDVTGIELIPGNCGENCPGNGEHLNKDGNITECCCNECDYLMCCLKEHSMAECTKCTDNECPNSPDRLNKK